jgi:hypothetical protein
VLASLATPEITPTIERGPAEDSGLPGRSRTPVAVVVTASEP